VENSNPIPAVFDCNVLIQAAASRQNVSSACFRLVEAGVVRLFASEGTLRELEVVLGRDYIKEEFRYTDELIQEFLTKLRISATVVDEVPQVFFLPRDVDDEQYINLGVCVKAAFIVTSDNDLLDLMTNFDVKSKEFRQKTRPLKIVKPMEFLRIVEEQTKKDLAIEP
jgi:putative PIN family toxin of toxin-antitoxin system